MSDLILSRDLSSVGLKKGGIILNWTPSGTSQQIHYTTKKSSDKKFYVIDVQDDVGTYHFNRPEISLSEIYLFKVVSSSEKKSNTLEVSFLSDRPDIPIFTSVVSMDNSLKFKMQMGALNGSVVSMMKFFLSNGNEIFSVERPLNSLNEFVLSAEDGISNYEEYEIACSVSSNRGDSELSDGVVHSPSDYPNVPQMVFPSESDRKAVLSWVKPSDFSQWEDTFVAIHIWYKEMFESTFTEILITDKHALSYELLNLTNGVFYHFQVAYENEYGINEHTVKSILKSFSPFGIPSPPEVLYIDNITESSMKVRFKTTSDLNGTDLYRYWVSVYSNNVFVKTVNGEAPSPGEHHILITDLTKGEDYTISVSVEGRKNKSDGTMVALESVQSNSLTKRPFSNASPVLNLTSTAFDNSVAGMNRTLGGQLLIRHDVPLDNGGFPIEKYIVTLTNSGVSTAKEYASAPVIVDGLTNGVVYDIDIRAYTLNTNVSSELQSTAGEIASFSQSSNPTTGSFSVPGNRPLKIPSAVQNARVDELDRRVKVTWEEPLDSGGSPILNYYVDVQAWNVSGNPFRLNSGTLSASAREWSSPQELINGQIYTVVITAYNQNNTAGGATIMYKTPFGLQSFSEAPVVNNKSITFKINTNGRPVTEYHVVAIDDDKLNDGSEEVYVKTVVTNTEQMNIVEFTKHFHTLSGPIAKYLIVAESSLGSSVYKTTFTDASV